MPHPVPSRCEHPSCKCETRHGERYCSDACRVADESSRAHAHAPIDDPCPCGHPACQGEA